MGSFRDDPELDRRVRQRRMMVVLAVFNASLPSWTRRVGLWVGVLVTVVGCGPKPRAVEPVKPSRGYILISLDTVSAQHLSLYGYERETTPFLESLAPKAVVFENAFVQLPGTLPSHMSMFTGLYPDQHNVFPPDGVLASEIPTLPEIFKAGGFQTIGHTDGGFVSGRFGFYRGFDEFNDERIILWTKRDHTFRRGLKSLRALPQDQRFFLFVHTYAAHDPYTPPRECQDLFWSGPPPEGAKLSASAVLIDHNRGLAPLNEEIADYYCSQYDAEIRCLDTEIGYFFTGLRELGLADDVTVIITADHGEEFLQHGKMAHEQIYNENLRVPLVVVAPGVKGGRRIAQVVETVDIAPTLYELAGLSPPPGLPGRSLAPLLTGAEKGSGGEAFTRSISGDRGLYAMSREGLLHVVTPSQLQAAWEGLPVASAIQRWIEPRSLELEAMSFLEPVVVTASLDGAVFAEVNLTADRWTTIKIPVVEDGRSHLLRLSADRCQTVPESVERGKPYCLSFYVNHLPAREPELYRADVDPHEGTDLSQNLVAQRDALLERLEAFRFEAVCPAQSEPLEPEVRDQLRALGYLR
jgi:arylsulfatase A-like enzyme